MIKINSVYTGTGAVGRTVLGDGVWLPKFHIRVAVTRSVGEANAFFGWARATPTNRCGRSCCVSRTIDIDADLRRSERPGLKIEPLRLQETQVAWLEAHIDAHNETPRSLTSFVLPGRSEGSLLPHIARTIVRRAEREITEMAFEELIAPAVIR
jgi:cob(I)alamin adenosyltransferase